MPKRGGPKPKHLKLLEAADAVDDSAPAEPGDYSCPLPLTDTQAQIWSDLVAQLSALGLMRQVFWPSVYGLTVALATLQECNAAIDKPTVKGSNGYEKKHPASTMANQALTHIRTYSAELGLTPAGLAKLGPSKKGAPSKMDKLIRGAK